ncbi:MAG: DUF302 domain-containing protein [Gammaproteobacteria bacterium]|nr:DUF302 domain-containing protein [Gammaproteobacteria bacterium]MCP5202010.1 DUF302 domain-containing protein [Gammaproteobacteria bacterium]
MRMRLRGWLGVVLLVALGAAQASTAGPEHAGDIVRYTTDKSFDDVIFELNFAITERNFRITGRNTIGAGLRKRGYSDFPEVEVIHFCSLELAREVLLIDPGFVAQMPCRITIHEQDGRTVVSLIRLPVDHPDERVNAFARRMNATLTEIVEFAVSPDGD